MASKQRSVEEIIGKLREAEVALAQAETVAQACRGIGPYVLPMAPAVWGAVMFDSLVKTRFEEVPAI